jgi:hypothetical protein
MDRALIGRIKVSTPRRLKVNTTNTARPSSVRPTALNRVSSKERSSSGRMATCPEKRLSMAQMEIPSLQHLSRVPLSQSNPANPKDHSD